MPPRGEGFIKSIPEGMTLSSIVYAITAVSPHTCSHLGSSVLDESATKEKTGQDEISLKRFKYERSLTSTQLAQALRPNYERAKRSSQPWNLQACRCHRSSLVSHPSASTTLIFCPMVGLTFLRCRLVGKTSSRWTRGLGGRQAWCYGSSELSTPCLSSSSWSSCKDWPNVCARRDSESHYTSPTVTRFVVRCVLPPPG